MRLVFLGSPPFAPPVFAALMASRHDVAALVVRPDRPRGRGRKVKPSPLAVMADKAGVPVLQPSNTKQPELLDELRALEPDVLVVASFGEILRTELLELAPHGALNVHASLLPRWRGASPIQRAILEGDAETGVSVQRIVLALDEGDVVVERRTPIGPEETSGELLERLAVLGGEAIVLALDRIEAGTAVFEPQDESAATYAAKLEKADGRLDLARPAEELARRVRGLSPWPGARVELLDGRELVVLAARATEGDGEPGTLLDAKRAILATGAGGLELVRVKPPGKGAMDGPAFLRGARLETGERIARADEAADTAEQRGDDGA